MMQTVQIEDLGLISYEKAWAYQQTLVDDLVTIKKVNRLLDTQDQSIPTHHFLFCEHKPVYTLGRTGKKDHLLLDHDALKRKNIEFFKINRGGDITYHGPGQVVGYPIFDLDWFFTDVHKYVRYLEEVIIQTVAAYGVTGIRMEGFTGVWITDDAQHYRKICAIGVHLSRWITMHGFALNVNNDLSYFSNIVPCGIADPNKSVTSLSQELGHAVDLKEIKQKIIFHFSQLFGFTTTSTKTQTDY